MIRLLICRRPIVGLFSDALGLLLFLLDVAGVKLFPWNFVLPFIYDQEYGSGQFNIDVLTVCTWSITFMQFYVCLYMHRESSSRRAQFFSGKCSSLPKPISKQEDSHVLKFAGDVRVVVQEAVGVGRLDHLHQDGRQLALQRQKTLGKCRRCHL